MKILVLGLGNILLQDEGIGVRVIEKLQADYVFPNEVELMDGNTAGLELLPFIEDADRVVIVDAIKSRRAPGELVRLVNDEIPAFLGTKVSPHQVSLQDILALTKLRGTIPGEVVLWGVQPGDLDFGLELSATIATQVAPLCARVIEELARWGISASCKIA